MLFGFGLRVTQKQAQLTFFGPITSPFTMTRVFTSIDKATTLSCHNYKPTLLNLERLRNVTYPSLFLLLPHKFVYKKVYYGVCLEKEG